MSEAREFGVWCRVSGGVTGTREAWLKRNGELQRFESREAAQEVADELNAMERQSTASFKYSAREMTWAGVRQAVRPFGRSVFG